MITTIVLCLFVTALFARGHDDDDDDDNNRCDGTKLIQQWASNVQSSNVGAIIGMYENDAVIAENFGGQYFTKRGRDVEVSGYWNSLYVAGGLGDSTTGKSTFSITYDSIVSVRPGVVIAQWHGTFIPFNVTTGLETFVINMKTCRIMAETALVITSNQGVAPTPTTTTTTTAPKPSPTPAPVVLNTTTHVATLCEKWANESTIFKGDQLKMVTAVVVGVFGDEIGSDLGRQFFNGTTPCNSRDFINNTANQGALVTSLVAFFGLPSVLGCTQPGYPAYTGDTNMTRVHEHMPITQAVFDLFVNSLVAVVQGALAPDVPSLAADIGAVAGVLNSPAVAGICNQPDCTKQTNGVNGVAFYQPVKC